MVEFGYMSPEFEPRPEVQIELPPELCVYDVGAGVDGRDYNEASVILNDLGLSGLATQLGEYEDGYRECGRPGCSSFINLSNQAGTIMMLDHGRGADGCLKAKQ